MSKTTPFSEVGRSGGTRSGFKVGCGTVLILQALLIGLVSFGSAVQEALSLPFLATIGLRTAHYDVVKAYNMSYLEGRWYYEPKPFNMRTGVHKCCTWDPGYNDSLYVSAPWCRVEGNEEPHTVVATVGHNCYCATYPEELGENKAKNLPLGEWIFVHDHRYVPRFNAKAFCNILRDRYVIFLGDSTFSQTAAALANHILEGDGSCAKQVRTFLSDTLEKEPNKRGPDLSTAYQRIIDQKFDSIVILGVGAHLNDLESYKKHIAKASKYMSTVADENVHGPHVRVLWKTNNPPHYNCASIREPFVAATLPGRHLGEVNDPKQCGSGPACQHSYGFWNHAVLYDKLAMKTMAEAVSGFLDVSPLYLRGDSKSTDCLHFCTHNITHNPLNHVSRLVYQALLEPGRIVY